MSAEFKKGDRKRGVYRYYSIKHALEARVLFNAAVGAVQQIVTEALAATNPQDSQTSSTDSATTTATAESSLLNHEQIETIKSPALADFDAFQKPGKITYDAMGKLIEPQRNDNQNQEEVSEISLTQSTTSSELSSDLTENQIKTWDGGLGGTINLTGENNGTDAIENLGTSTASIINYTNTDITYTTTLMGGGQVVIQANSGLSPLIGNTINLQGGNYTLSLIQDPGNIINITGGGTDVLTGLMGDTVNLSADNYTIYITDGIGNTINGGDGFSTFIPSNVFGNTYNLAAGNNIISYTAISTGSLTFTYDGITNTGTVSDGSLTDIIQNIQSFWGPVGNTTTTTFNLSNVANDAFYSNSPDTFVNFTLSSGATTDLGNNAFYSFTGGNISLSNLAGDLVNSDGTTFYTLTNISNTVFGTYISHPNDASFVFTYDSGVTTDGGGNNFGITGSSSTFVGLNNDTIVTSGGNPWVYTINLMDVSNTYFDSSFNQSDFAFTSGGDGGGNTFHLGNVFNGSVNTFENLSTTTPDIINFVNTATSYNTTLSGGGNIILEANTNLSSLTGNTFTLQNGNYGVTLLNDQGNIFNLTGGGTESFTGLINDAVSLSSDAYIISITSGGNSTLSGGNGLSTIIPSSIFGNAYNLAAGANIIDYSLDLTDLLTFTYDTSINTGTVSNGILSDTIQNIQSFYLNTLEGVNTSTIIYAASGGISYSLTGADASLFSIDSNGNVTFNAASDYETAPNHGTNGQKGYSFTIDTLASNGITHTQEFITMNVSDVAPVFNNASTTVSVPEDNGILYVASATDPGTNSNGGITYTLTGQDAALLAIDASGVVTRVNNNGVLNYESAPNHGSNGQKGYSFTIDGVGTNGIAHSQEAVVINILDVSPQFTNNFTTFSVPEGTSTSAIVYTASIANYANYQGEIVYTLTGADANNFSIDPLGNITFNNSPDYNTSPNHGTNGNPGHAFTIDAVTLNGTAHGTENIIVDVTSTAPLIVPPPPNSGSNSGASNSTTTVPQTPAASQESSSYSAEMTTSERTYSTDSFMSEILVTQNYDSASQSSETSESASDSVISSDASYKSVSSVLSEVSKGAFNQIMEGEHGTLYVNTENGKYAYVANQESANGASNAGSETNGTRTHGREGRTNFNFIDRFTFASSDPNTKNIMISINAQGGYLFLTTSTLSQITYLTSPNDVLGLTKSLTGEVVIGAERFEIKEPSEKDIIEIEGSLNQYNGFDTQLKKLLTDFSLGD